MNGRGGLIWYLPTSVRRSKKLTPAACTCTRNWSARSGLLGTSASLRAAIPGAGFSGEMETGAGHTLLHCRSQALAHDGLVGAGSGGDAGHESRGAASPVRGRVSPWPSLEVPPVVVSLLSPCHAAAVSGLVTSRLVLPVFWLARPPPHLRRWKRRGKPSGRSLLPPPDSRLAGQPQLPPSAGSDRPAITARKRMPPATRTAHVAGALAPPSLVPGPHSSPSCMKLSMPDMCFDAEVKRASSPLFFKENCFFSKN